MKLLIDAYTGLSGDKICAGLIDLGIDIDYIKNSIKKINLSGYSIDSFKTKKSGFAGRKFKLNIIEKQEKHRSYNDIKNIVLNSTLNDNIKKLGLKIFENVAVAESKSHGIDPEKVHFHEIGAIDSIIDIIVTAICIDFLNIEKVYYTPISVGSGQIKCQHGIIPNPSPAALELLNGLKINYFDKNYEFTTPTGAGIIKTLFSSNEIPNNIIPYKIGYGIGNFDLDIPNILRVILFNNNEQHETIMQIETHIDNMNPEWYDILIEKIYNAGALDIFLSSGMMKKNRPATKITILSERPNFDDVINALFLYSTTLGIRYFPVNRIILSRDVKEINTKYGIVKYKEYSGYMSDKGNVSIEFESLKKISEEIDIPIKKINDELLYIISSRC